VTSATALASHPLNTIVPYYTMFRPEFPLAALQDASGWVLDPFCGRGTTNFAARVLGLPSVGIDASPIAVAIASAKLVAATVDDVVALAATLIGEHREDVECPTGEFWDLAYHPETLRELCALREGLSHADSADPAIVVLRALALGALHGPRGKSTQSYFSNQMPRTYATKPAGAVRFWKLRDMQPEYVSALRVIERRALRVCQGAPAVTSGAIIHGDSRSVQLLQGLGPFSHVVTSPPYYGMRTYVTDQWLRNWFLGGPDEPDYAADRQLVTSNPDEFSQDLALVWRNIAGHCAPGCRLTIRFGALPSIPSDPEAVIVSSLEGADAGWRVRSIADAGTADAGRRQAHQFGFVRSKPITEIDVIATLRG